MITLFCRDIRDIEIFLNNKKRKDKKNEFGKGHSMPPPPTCDKNIERQSSSGRSMVEILGVLAVIGVLSIGGLAGFKIAMNYHRANETIHEVMLRATNVPMKWEDYLSRKGSNDEFEFPDLGTYETKNAVGYTMET